MHVFCFVWNTDTLGRFMEKESNFHICVFFYFKMCWLISTFRRTWGGVHHWHMWLHVCVCVHVNAIPQDGHQPCFLRQGFSLACSSPTRPRELTNKPQRAACLISQPCMVFYVGSGDQALAYYKLNYLPSPQKDFEYHKERRCLFANYLYISVENLCEIKSGC